MLAIVLCVFRLIILVTFYLPKGRYQDLEDQVREQNIMEKILSVIMYVATRNRKALAGT